eukprot:jgi/Mesvir1/17893/Mv12963-RA.1
MEAGGEAAQCALDAQPMDVDFHPSRKLIAVGTIDGHVQIFEYEGDRTNRKLSSKLHAESARAVRFIENGRMLLSASADRTIAAVDTETCQLSARLTDAHSCPINRLAYVSENIVASGDDEGCVKVWDTRQRKCVALFEDVHEDFVADMCYAADHQRLLTVSGDATLACLNLRKSKVEARSEDQEDELMSVQLLKHGKKIVCGTGEGVLHLFSWPHFGDCSDRFPGHPQSIDGMVKVDEDTIITGSSDGLIRIVSVLPNKMLGIIGEHAEYPIERLAISPDRAFLASASHDNSVKIWDIAFLQEKDEDGMQEADAAEGGAQDAGKAVAGDSAGAGFDPMDHSDSDDDGPGKSGKRRVKRATKKNNLGAGPSGGSGSFFADL